MSVWPGKYVIGLTGNIATGKSVVRKMLEHLGAYGVDADGLAHRAIARGAPGYQAVVDTFGHWILGPDGQIERPKLGRLVFADADALERLEAIVHPLVQQAVDILIRRAPYKIVVIEAIKLLESGLSKSCDAIWVTYAPEKQQLERLTSKRKMEEETAKLRVAAQPSQEDKVRSADVVIQNSGSFEETWKQVLQSWTELVPVVETGELEPVIKPGELVVQRARPSQAKELAELITRLSNGGVSMNSSDVMEAFGEKAFLVLRSEHRPVGLVGWQVENLVARTLDVFIEDKLPVDEAMRTLMEEVETASRNLQCEASLLFLPPGLAKQRGIWAELGYEQITIEALRVRAWQEAARESMPDGTVLLYKKLREDRVLRPV